MSNKVRRIPLILAILILGIAATALISSIFADEIFPEYSPSHRGFHTAVEAGCFSCHSLDGETGSPNPVSQNIIDNVPSLTGERHSITELRQWIENGISEERSKSDSYLQSREQKILKMPAYKSRLNPDEIDDLVAYLALMQYGRSSVPGDSPAAKGERLARKYSCFTCHGELGQGGVENPKSLKGYIPGFFGTDFRALTQNGNREHIRQWILDGRSEFFWNQGFAGIYPSRYFTNRQAIQMPAYKGVIPEEDVEILIDYLVELMNLGPINAEKLQEYESLTESSGEQESISAPQNSTGSNQAAVKGLEILKEHCFDCHGEEKQRSRYRLDSREAAIQGGEISDFLGQTALNPGDSDNSMLIRYVEATEEIPSEEIYPMPPGQRSKLNREQIQILKKWIDAGFEWPR